jgi:hypothetical protein
MQFAGRHLPVTLPEGSDQNFSIAAPILAGFAVTLLGVLVPLNPPTLVPLREPAMLVVAGAGVPVHLLSALCDQRPQSPYHR